MERRVCKGKGEDCQSESRMSPCRGEATKEQHLSFDGHDEWDQMQNQGDDVATSEQDLELIKERERAVRQLQAHTLDVRQRFKDLTKETHSQHGSRRRRPRGACRQSHAGQFPQAAYDQKRKSLKNVCILVLVLLVITVPLVLSI